MAEVNGNEKLSFKEHTAIFTRAVGHLYKNARAFTVITVLHCTVNAVWPYVTLWCSARLIDALVMGAPRDTLLSLAALNVGVNFVLALLSAYLSSQTGLRYDASIRLENCNRAQKTMELSFVRLEDTETANHRARVDFASQTGYNWWGLVGCLQDMVAALTKIVSSVALSFSVFLLPSVGTLPKASVLLLLILTLIASAKVAALTAKAFGEFFTMCVPNNHYCSRFSEFLEDYAMGKDVRLYAMEDMAATAYGKANEELCRADMRCNVKRALYTLPGLLPKFLLEVLLYVLLIFAASEGDISVGTIAQYTGCFMMLVAACSSLSALFEQIKINNVYLKDYFAFYDIENEMYKGSLSVEKRLDNDYEIEFRDVSFRYPGASEDALSHVSLKFKIGEKLAVVGENGSGKTTFIKLMCRLYDPSSGEILLNGVNIQKYDYDEYLAIFSVVFQDFTLFAFSLGENVACARGYDRARAEQCLIAAGFGERLATLERGLDTCLYRDFEPDGIEISGGEAQKIALARALYKNAPFVILDEPTAALDPVAEYDVYSRFNDIVGDKTTIYISHRLSSCRFCDKIAVFSHGHIVGEGSHDALLSENPVYTALWNAQAQYYREEG